MKYQRTKPNRHFWNKKKPVIGTATDTGDHFQSVVDEITAALAPTMEYLASITRSLDEICAIDGHIMSDRVYPDKIVCSRCGRTPREISSLRSASRS